MAGRPEKYAALRKFLEAKARVFRESGESVLPMSFKEIDALGVRLPPSAYNHRAWWSNENTGRPWGRSFKPENVNMQDRTLNFRYKGGFSAAVKSRQTSAKEAQPAGPIDHSPSRTLRRKSRQSEIGMLRKELDVSVEKISTPGMAEATRPYTAERKKCHPAFGSMRGLIRVAAGTDLTEPATDAKSWKPR